MEYMVFSVGLKDVKLLRSLCSTFSNDSYLPRALRDGPHSQVAICFLVNGRTPKDIVSLPKDKMGNREGLNGISMIRKYGLASTEEEALAKVSEIIVQNTRQLKKSIKQALADPALSSDMKGWMIALPYVVSRNASWGQLVRLQMAINLPSNLSLKSGRYNFPGLPAPRMSINIEGQGDIIEPIQFSNLEFDKLVDGVPFSVQKSESDAPDWSAGRSNDLTDRNLTF
ncbi:hypothetical protein BDP27DRAFT_1373264 [Rhodocollybia butyracea]|uniref:Uncharacterized protein n=1 Tax=Rhodocollybia butyracea TaxID=206335 RepID=A0A9P5P6U6_9AGAR|nr:hypothetical protein BDP27DRAFT_1373264 [Rhodocollybia butyracea]